MISTQGMRINALHKELVKEDPWFLDNKIKARKISNGPVSIKGVVAGQPKS